MKTVYMKCQSLFSRKKKKKKKKEKYFKMSSAELAHRVEEAVKRWLLTAATDEFIANCIDVSKIQ